MLVTMTAALALGAAGCSTEDVGGGTVESAAVGPEPKVRLNIPAALDGARTERAEITVKGRVTRRATVQVEGDRVDVAGGRFAAVVPLRVGRNRIQIVARRAGFTTARKRVVVVRREPPAPAPTATPTPTPTPTPEPAPDCHPGYEGACLDPGSYDYDCEGGSGDGPDYTGMVRVVGDDPYDLDRDGDGIACDV
jgi:hypothetical protein